MNSQNNVICLKRIVEVYTKQETKNQGGDNFIWTERSIVESERGKL